jgi:hypothetical protein
MPTNFPDEIDQLLNPNSSNALNNPSHSQQHADVNDAIEAIQAKIGINNSEDPNSLEYKINNVSAGAGDTGPTGPTGAIGPAGSFYNSTTPPPEPTEGDVWFNTEEAIIYVYYDSYWVEWSAAGIGPTGPGVPSGGDTGQVLAKASSSNNDAEWITPDTGITTGKAIAMAIVFG